MSFTPISAVLELNLDDEELAIGDTTEFVTKMNSMFSEIQAWAASYKTAITSINALGTELAAAETSNTGDIEALQDEVALKMDSAVTSLTKMSELASAIVLLQSNIADLAVGNIDGLNQELTALSQTDDADRAARESAVSTLQASIDSLQSQINTIDDGAGLDVAEISAAVDSVNAVLDTLGASPGIANVNGLQAELTRIETEASARLDVVEGAANYDAIAKTITDTAVDVFIYDTRNDSDGGAWRKRCQHTSWYNEELDTATRGSKREFPVVAIVVAEAATITIYDADDSDFRMWMVFTVSNNNIIRGNGGGVTSVSLFNGYMAVGIVGGWAGSTINFLLDGKDIDRDLRNVKYLSDIARRNVGHSDAPESLQIINSNVNSVAMTVLPDAPIDHITGLPVPTIAVGTDGGVSIIKHDGTVVDWTKVSNYVRQVAFRLSDNALCATFDSNSTVGINRFRHVLHKIPDQDKLEANAFHHLGDSDEFYPQYLDSSYVGASLILSSGHPVYSNGFIGDADAGHTQLSLIHPNKSDPTKGMLAAITSSYNTGWMVGDTKACLLCSTDATNLVGSGELVTNGEFDSDIAGWVENTSGVVTWDASGAAVIGTGDNTTNTVFQQALTMTVGRVYVITFELSDLTGAFGVKVGFDGVYADSGKYFSNGTHTITHKATASAVDLMVYRFRTHTGEIKLNSISVRLADEDRSVNANILAVNGTITREAVSADSDIVAYSGFSSLNYLEQPYNPDLDFGTGDFSYSFWWKDLGIGTQAFFARTDAIGADYGSGSFQVFYNGGNLKVRGENFALSIPLSTVAGALRHVCVVRESGLLTLYVNGVSVGSISSPNSLSNTNCVLRIGQYYFNNAWYGYNSKLAFLKASSTAPSAEQIKKIYNDELKMFSNPSTLYGSSSDVKALAHDKSTGLMRAGTSAGRSDFDGLVRVNNTTTPVTTAISAVNGMIAEQ